jgi:hypothetical protein
MPAGVASALSSDFVSHPWVVTSSVSAFGNRLLCGGSRPELETMRIVNDAAEDGVTEGRIADYIVPAVHWELTGDQRSAAAVTFFGDLEQVVPLFGAKRCKAPVIEDEQLEAAERTHQARRSSVSVSQRQIDKEAENALVEGRSGCRGTPCGRGRSQDLPTSVGPSMIKFCGTSIQSPWASFWNRARSRPRGAR